MGYPEDLAYAARYLAEERFDENFADFRDRFGITDIYSGGFYPFPDLETYWAWWSRHIWVNRYVDPPKDTFKALLSVLGGRDYFVVTTNVDHQFQRAGFDKDRLFYMRGDYGLLQCSKPCHDATYDNEDVVRQMVEQTIFACLNKGEALAPAASTVNRSATVPKGHAPPSR